VKKFTRAVLRGGDDGNIIPFTRPWKKGQRYGTVLVDLEKRRIVQLLAERSVETSQAWLRKHPEIDLVSRDRGKIFREAATDGASQAKQVVDRFHLQKNFAEALEKFFRKRERVLKKATRGRTSNARPAEGPAVPQKVAEQRRARHRQRVRLHKRIWKLYREGYHKEQIAQIVGVSSRSVYRALEQEAPPPPRRRSRSSSIVDPYLSAPFFAMEPGVPQRRPVVRGNCRGIGYTGSRRTLELRLRPFRPRGAGPVSKQTVILDKPPTPRGVALMMVRPEHNRTAERRDHRSRLQARAGLWPEARASARGRGVWSNGRPLSRKVGVAELIAFVDGLAEDAEAVANGCSLTWSNGPVEGAPFRCL
jgi:hypothetical protein